MSHTKLAEAIRVHADKVDRGGPRSRDDDRTTAELIRCLARMIEGKTLYQAFGAPGDWGYETPIGMALAVGSPD